MHCTKQVLNDMLWVGADDRRLTCFEGVYGVPDGVSYNSYLLLDEKTVLFDTVDKAVSHTFFDNVAYGLNGRKLDAKCYKKTYFCVFSCKKFVYLNYLGYFCKRKCGTESLLFTLFPQH